MKRDDTYWGNFFETLLDSVPNEEAYIWINNKFQKRDIAIIQGKVVDIIPYFKKGCWYDCIKDYKDKETKEILFSKGNKYYADVRDHLVYSSGKSFSFKKVKITNREEYFTLNEDQSISSDD